MKKETDFMHCNALTCLAFAAAFTTMLPVLPASAHGPDKQAAPVYDGHAAALGHPGDPKAKARLVPLAMADSMRFHPEVVRVRTGETVRFVVRNAGQIKHEMMLGTDDELQKHAKLMQRFPEMEHDDPNGVTVEPARSHELVWKFTKPGTFAFACLIPGHFEAGMHGRIVVED
jgi:uncharacterized cupredoxin-like copper-binding protein